MSGLQETPAAQRLHIALYGRRNAGKSSLINALTGQQVALVSPVAGTTADPVKKAMELHPIGPVLFIDTAGYDDVGELGQLRVEATQGTLARADVALLVIAGEPTQEDLGWAQQLQAQNTPFLVVQTKGDLILPAQLPKELSERAVAVSAATGEGIEALRAALTALAGRRGAAGDAPGHPGPQGAAHPPPGAHHPAFAGLEVHRGEHHR